LRKSPCFWWLNWRTFVLRGRMFIFTEHWLMMDNITRIHPAI
jgi:hypothetical protein